MYQYILAYSQIYIGSPLIPQSTLIHLHISVKITFPYKFLNLKTGKCTQLPIYWNMCVHTSLYRRRGEWSTQKL